MHRKSFAFWMDMYACNSYSFWLKVRVETSICLSFLLNRIHWPWPRVLPSRRHTPSYALKVSLSIMKLYWHTVMTFKNYSHYPLYCVKYTLIRVIFFVKSNIHRFHERNLRFLMIFFSRKWLRADNRFM